MQRSKPLAAAWVAALLSIAHSACSAVPSSNSRNLQLEFGTATSLRIVNRWQDVEAAAAVPLKYLGEHFVVARPGYANIGDDWNATDSLNPNLPQALHIFSAYSNTLTASVFLLGGRTPTFYALLARRGAPNFCIFKLPDIALANARLSEIQYLLRPDRDQTIDQVPECHLQALDQPLRLP